MNNKELLEQYMESYKTRMSTVGFLIMGKQGMGKTTLLGTAPFPILVYSFDLNGQIVLREKIEEGKVLVIPFWSDKSEKPVEWARFHDMFHEHKESGFHDFFATVAVDSITYAIESLIWCEVERMNKESTKKREDLNPFIGDYRVFQRKFIDFTKEIGEGDYNLIFTAHLQPESDEITGEVSMEIVAPNKLRSLLAGLFTEKYCLIPGKVPNSRTLLTQPKRRYTASSQLASLAGLPPEIDNPNLFEFMKQAGLNPQNKEPLTKVIGR